MHQNDGVSEDLVLSLLGFFNLTHYEHEENTAGFTKWCDISKPHLNTELHGFSLQITRQVLYPSRKRLGLRFPSRASNDRGKWRTQIHGSKSDKTMNNAWAFGGMGAFLIAFPPVPNHTLLSCDRSFLVFMWRVFS